MNRGLGIGTEDSVSSSPAASLLRTPKGLDPSGTIKRLSTALQELDRLKAERNSYQAQNSALQMECERLLEKREGSLQDENRKLREIVIQLEDERDHLISTIRDLESSEKVSAVRAVEELRRAKEALEHKVESLQADLLQSRVTSESLRQELEQMSTDLTTLELERKELLSKLAGYIQRESELTRDTRESKGVHMRHSRLLASVILMERTNAYIRRLKSQFWSHLRLFPSSKQSIFAGLTALRTAISRKSQLNLRRKYLFWWEETVRSKGEIDKSALFHGYETRISKQSLFAIWQNVTERYREEKRKRKHRELLLAFVKRAASEKEEKQREKRLLSSFSAWKGAYLSTKRDHFRTELANLTHQSEHLHTNLSQEQAQHQQTLTLKALKAIMRQSRGQIFAAFSTWKQVTVMMRTQAPRLMRVIKRWRRGNEGRAISAWKEAVGIGKLSMATERLAILVGEVEKARAFKANYSRVRVRRFIKFAYKFQLKAGLRTLSHRIHMTVNKRISARKLWEWVRKYNLTVGWKQLAHAKLRGQAKKILESKLARLLVSDVTTRKKLLFQDWVNFIQTRKNARKVITKLLNEGYLEDKRKGLLSWRDNISALREAEHHSERLHLSRQLTETSAQLAHSQRRIQLKCLLLFERTADDASELRLRTGFSLWKEQAEGGRREREGTSRLVRLWNRHGLRKGVRTWAAGVRFCEEREWREKLVTAEKELKEQKRILKAQKESLEGTIEEKDQILMATNSDLDASKRQFQHIFEMYVKSKQVPRLTRKFILTRWRKLTIFTIKSYQSLFNLFQKRVLKQSLQSIKHYARGTTKQAWLHRCLHSLVSDFRSLALRRYTALWRTQVRLGREEELQAAWAQAEQRKLLESKVSSVIKERLSDKMKLVSEKFVQLRVVQEWKKEGRKRGKLRTAEYNLRVYREEAGVRRALACLKACLKQQKYHKLRHSKVINVMMGYMSKEIFKAWASRSASIRQLTKALRRTYHSLYIPFLWQSFESIRRQSIINKHHSQASKQKQSGSMARVIAAILKSKLSIGFSTWQSKVRKSVKYRRSLRKTTLGMVKRGLRTAWNSWTLQVRIDRETTYMERTGPAAKARAALLEKLLLLRKLLVREGVDMRKAEKYVMERESKGSAMVGMWTGVETTGNERFFKVWKLFYLRRRNIVRAAKHIRAYRRHPDLIHGFLAWKRHLVRYSREVVSASKYQLASLLSARYQDLDAVFTNYQQASAKKADLEQSCDLLISLVRKGQNQAISLMSFRVHTPMLQALSRWSNLAKSFSMHDLLTQSDQLHRDLNATTSYVHQITAESHSLSLENEELRRSAADGIAFAEALEEVGQENRDLRLELQQRSETVQRLVKENENLAMSLRRVKVEEKPEGSHRRMASGSLRYWQS